MQAGEWKALYNKLLNSNIDLSIAEELGLIIKPKAESMLTDLEIE